MKRPLFFVIVFSLIAFSGCTQRDLQRTLGSVLGTPLTMEQIVAGLKQALDQGVDRGTAQLARTDGYLGNALVRIALPSEAQTVANRLKVIPGFDNVEQELIRLLNRAAEDAAASAKPIFLSAIRNMTISDARNILMGEKNAATQYLERTTSGELYQAFRPIINNSLNRVNAVDYWEMVTTRYNQIPLVTPVTTSLDDYVTLKAMEGVFKMIEQEERNIRANPGQRTTDLMRRVFAEQDR